MPNVKAKLLFDTIRLCRVLYAGTVNAINKILLFILLDAKTRTNLSIQFTLKIISRFFKQFLTNAIAIETLGKTIK